MQNPHALLPRPAASEMESGTRGMKGDVAKRFVAETTVALSRDEERCWRSSEGAVFKILSCSTHSWARLHPRVHDISAAVAVGLLLVSEPLTCSRSPGAHFGTA